MNEEKVIAKTQVFEAGGHRYLSLREMCCDDLPLGTKVELVAEVPFNDCVAERLDAVIEYAKGSEIQFEGMVDSWGRGFHAACDRILKIAKGESDE